MKKISVKKGAALAMLLVAGYAFMGCSHSSDSSEDTVAENPGNTDDGSGDVIDAGDEGNKSSGNEDSPEDETNGESDVKVTAIEISGSSNVAKGSSVTLKATVSPSNATAKGVSWSTDVSEGVSVANGKVSVDSSCTATEINVTATAKDGSGVSATYKISVVDVSSISAGITITEEKGWLETAYIKWNAASSEMIDGYNVYVKGLDGEYEKIDDMLVRAYSSTAGGSTIDYYRADALGLKAGVYQMKVVGTTGGIEAPNVYSESSAITVEAHDRSGFAFFNYNEGIGAYNNDGTLKSGAKVLYITKDNVNTVTLDVIVNNKGKVETRTGLGNILAGKQKGFDTTPWDIRIIGTISANDIDSAQLLSDEKGLQLKGNKDTDKMNVTLEGVGDDATLHGFGMTFYNGTSCEMRNLGLLWFNDDGVQIKGTQHIWVHHLDIFYGQPGSAADQKKGDGSLDVKDNSRYATFSYNHFWDSGKMSLCGMKSESGENWITYHHNWFDHSDSRHPRIRTMSVHVYNNYYDGNSKYGVGAAKNSEAFVEANYFRNCKFPMMSSLQGNDVYAGTSNYKPSDYGTFSDEDGGIIKAYNNKIVDTANISSYWPYSGTGVNWTKGVQNSLPNGIDTTVHFDAWEAANRNDKVPATVKAFVGGKTYSNFDTDSSKMYEYTADTPDEAKDKVMAFAGRLGKGDFSYTFADSDDTNDSVDTTLKGLVQNYKSKLVKVMGDSSSGSGASGNDDGSDDDSGDDNGGTTGGTETPAEMPEGTVVVTFDSFTSGATVNGVTITGSLKSGIAEKTYNGTTYKTALKMESSSTSISFTLSAASTLTIVTDTASKKIKIGEDAYQTDSDGVVTQSLSAGSYTVTKKDSMNVYAIIIEPAE